MPKMELKSRLDWNDNDWAKYLDCPVEAVQKHKKVLDDTYLTTIGRKKDTNLYHFVMYKYDYAPSGIKRLQLMHSGNHGFISYKEAVVDANNIISSMELTDFWAQTLNVPNRAIQMLLIRQK